MSCKMCNYEFKNGEVLDMTTDYKLVCPNCEHENDMEYKLKDNSSKKQVGGSHYQLPIQPIDYITKNKLPYSEGNVVKYITRHRDKNGAEDIMKCIHYCQFILEHEYNVIVDVEEASW